VSGTQFDFNPQLYKTGATGPATRANHLATIAGNITVQPACRGIYVGGTGDISVVMAGGRFETAQANYGPTDAQVNDTTIFKAVPAGSILPVMVIQILQSGTTATDLILLY
jgi:hypothetical protein